MEESRIRVGNVLTQPERIDAAVDRCYGKLEEERGGRIQTGKGKVERSVRSVLSVGEF